MGSAFHPAGMLARIEEIADPQFVIHDRGSS